VIVEVEAGDLTRCTATSEEALYELVHERVRSGPSRHATLVRVVTDRNDRRLIVELQDDAPGPGRIPDHLVDAIEALGGSVTATDGPDGPRIRAEVPCASS